jgi:hypothetical protein
MDWRIDANPDEDSVEASVGTLRVLPGAEGALEHDVGDFPDDRLIGKLSDSRRWPSAHDEWYGFDLWWKLCF